MDTSSSKGLVNFLKQIRFYINSINVLLASIIGQFIYIELLSFKKGTLGTP